MSRHARQSRACRAHIPTCQSSIIVIFLHKLPIWCSLFSLWTTSIAIFGDNESVMILTYLLCTSQNNKRIVNNEYLHCCLLLMSERRTFVSLLSCSSRHARSVVLPDKRNTSRYVTSRRFLICQNAWARQRVKTWRDEPSIGESERMNERKKKNSSQTQNTVHGRLPARP